MNLLYTKAQAQPHLQYRHTHVTCTDYIFVVLLYQNENETTSVIEDISCNQYALPQQRIP